MKLYPTPAAAPESFDFSNLPALSGLIGSLQSFGCEVNNADRYQKLKNMPLQSVPVPPETVLDMSPEDFLRDIESYGIAVAASNATADRRSALDRILDTDMAASLREQVDEFLDVLRPKFDLAAAEARAVIALGIQPDDTAERVMALGGEASERWISFKAGSKSVRTLARITAIRAQLAEITGAGEGPDADHSIGITRPFIPRADRSRNSSEPPHVKWLNVAQHLELVPFADLSPDDILQAQGYDVDELRIQANSQK